MKNKSKGSVSLAVGRNKISVSSVLITIVGKAFVCICTVFAFAASAKAQADTTMQTVQKVDMAYTMRSNGKIYVVVTVLCMVLLGLFIYLIRLDRKISKLEKEI
jgi:CcmD family protein